MAKAARPPRQGKATTPQLTVEQTMWAPPGVVYEYSTRYYGDWMARHERSHLKHMGQILSELSHA